MCGIEPIGSGRLPLPPSGLTHLKIKLNGDDLAWDVERAVRVDRGAAETQACRPGPAAFQRKVGFRPCDISGHCPRLHAAAPRWEGRKVGERTLERCATLLAAHTPSVAAIEANTRPATAGPRRQQALGEQISRHFPHHRRDDGHAPLTSPAGAQCNGRS